MALTQFTTSYKTFLKRALRQSMASALTGHPDSTVARTQVALDFSLEDFTLPIVIVGFQEQTLPNAGVGHYEWFPSPTNPALYVEYQHRMYKGNASFTIYAQTSADRDLVSDAMIEILAMNEVSSPGQSFVLRFYNQTQANSPAGIYHYPTLNTDLINPMGEQPVPPPWSPEDTLIYQTGYSVPVFGEFYSYVPPQPPATGLVSEVDVYEWPVDANGVALDPSNPAPPTPASSYQRYTGFPPGSKTVPSG